MTWILFFPLLSSIGVVTFLGLLLFSEEEREREGALKQPSDHLDGLLADGLALSRVCCVQNTQAALKVPLTRIFFFSVLECLCQNGFLTFVYCQMFFFSPPTRLK